ncbi:MAG: 4-hydroxybutyrate CoA-transferase [Oligoflexia bacterium]|nr:4-hydroxybutyrate CoA-transferase [Oligoflexia bacterium]
MDDWKSKAVAPGDCIKLLKNNNNVYIHGAAATPTPLLQALSDNHDLHGLKLFHLHLEGQVPFAEGDRSEGALSVSMFTGPALRAPIAAGHADYMPVFLSDIPGLFRSGQIPLDAALLQLSPPDSHGFCSLGTSVDTARAAADSAKLIIAEINMRMPRTHGSTLVKFDDIDAFTISDRPLIEHQPRPETPVDGRIGELIANLIEDRSTLQVGVGAIPDAVLSRLRGKADLGVHTETFSDGLVELVRLGVVTNRYKALSPGRIVTSFVSGSRGVLDFVDDNPLVHFLPCDETNDTALIRKNDRVVAVNSAIQIDLSGQVCADSIGHKIYSGIGGQVDFIRGAALSKGGKPIIALPSTAQKGTVSRIVMELSPGAGVVTTRGHIHWVVTEYGAVNLHGKTLRQRAELLISIAHPDFRQELRSTLAGVRHFVVGE